MKKLSVDSFTYGVEIEGAFENLLLGKLSKKCNLDMQSDGSVNSTVRERNLSRVGGALAACQEISLGVFSRKRDLDTVLKMVKSEKNHFWDKSCGLHLHLKAKKDHEEIVSLVFETKFLYDLQEFARQKLCSHIPSRLKKYHCKAYASSKDIIAHYQHYKKYRFVRRHPEYHTLEFRFFSPCEHKADNVSKFLDYFSKRISQAEFLMGHTFKIKKPKTAPEELITITHKLACAPQQQVINL